MEKGPEQHTTPAKEGTLHDNVEKKPCEEKK